MLKNSISLDKKALYLTLGIFFALAIYRAVHLWLTGFYVSDEYGYITRAMGGEIYSDRYFFGYVNIFLFQIFGISSVDKFVVFFPFYIFLWISITIFSVYKMLKTFEFDERTRATSLISYIFVVSFSVLSLGIITEPVGLAMATLGLLAIVKVWKSWGYKKSVYALFSAACFWAATYSREAYIAFFYGGLLIIVIISMMSSPKLVKKLRSIDRRWYLTLVLAILLYGAVVTVDYKMIGSRITSEAASLVGSVTETFRSALVVESVTVTAPPSTTAEQPATTASEAITSNQPQVTQEQPTISDLKSSQLRQIYTINPRIINTVYIFLGGLFLGSNPIIFFVLSIGFVLNLYRTIRYRREKDFVLLLCAGVALASYFGVSYIFSTDPNYLTLRHFSTIIRFSATATPAAFLLIPYVISIINKRNFSYAFIGSLLILTSVSAPVYSVYLSSNLPVQNPFYLNYKYPDVLLRDYFVKNIDDGPFRVIGNPFWSLTPGTNILKDHVKIYPYSKADLFEVEKWDEFYVFGSSRSLLTIEKTSPVLYDILKGVDVQDQGFRVIEVKTVLNETGVPFVNDVFLTKVVLEW